ncbi:hypothetical protein COOONC_26168 [Cooperia oncophora]
MNWTNVVKSGSMVKSAIDKMAAGESKYENETQFPFYMFDQKASVKPFPDRVGLGYLLGYPAGENGAPNLVSPFVDTNWKDPHGTDGYAFYIDQPSTLLPYTYHVKAWNTYQNMHVFLL